jgi:hypothetical protein
MKNVLKWINIALGVSKKRMRIQKTLGMKDYLAKEYSGQAGTHLQYYHVTSHKPRYRKSLSIDTMLPSNVCIVQKQVM